MNTATAKLDLLANCESREYREALVFENVYTGISSQIRVLREQRELSQAALGRKAKMAQERISILEDPNAETKPTLNTLLRVASAYDVGLDVRFVPFSTVLDRSTKTDSSELEVPSFDEEKSDIKAALQREEQRKPAATTLRGLATGSYDVDRFSFIHSEAVEAIRRYSELSARGLTLRGLAGYPPMTEDRTSKTTTVSNTQTTRLKIVKRNTQRWSVADLAKEPCLERTA